MMFTTLVRTMTLEAEMLDHNTLSSVAEQMRGGLEVTGEQNLSVKLARSNQFRHFLVTEW
jgi:hypothetical protein